MAPIQQFVSTAASNSDLTTSRTRDFGKSVHKVKKESYNSSNISSSHSDAAHSITNGSRLGDATQQETLVPISSRGHFFSDAFFKDARQHFESAVRNVLERRGHSRSSVHDDLTSYRMLRQADLSEGSQAATVTENATCHQVVMDVRDFMAEDVKVKVVDEDELVVEGSVEQRSGGSVSKKSFRRSFTFPGLVKAADITSTMSSDGVLTVTVPKKKHEGKITNITVHESNTKSNTSADSARTNTSAQNTKTNSNKTNTACENTKTTSSAAESSWVLLPVFSKGPFFHDSFFEESRQHFEAAVKEALGRLGKEEEAAADDLSLYRSLRAKDMTDASQAVKVTEDEHGHQVVLDVRDFQGGDVRVKMVGSNEVQVEGRLEKEEGGCSSTRSFRRRFHLPGVLDVAAVTSALSSDGVLTIRAPKGRPAAGKPSC